VETAHLLVQEGAKVKAFEPYKTTAKFGVELVSSLAEVFADAEAVLVLVPHTPIRTLEPEVVGKIDSSSSCDRYCHTWPQLMDGRRFKGVSIGVGRF
jgi:UDP-N-acetyl-D-mannosaminuronate dehydrogenase